jgi:protein MAK11
LFTLLLEVRSIGFWTAILPESNSLSYTSPASLEMAKRKRDPEESVAALGPPESKKKELAGDLNGSIQIITGSYERVLHGIRATISETPSGDTPSTSVQFADTFLFNAHASAIRCLALSPLSEPSSTQSPSILLASGGTDERVNVYSLSAVPPLENERLAPMPSLGGNKISENPRNRELGALLHHSSSITSLQFPTRSKLLSAAEDNTIAISRTSDLSVVSTIKAPHPKVQGRPSGDTAPPGADPAGINDFAIHSSMKLMLSVGKGERCMRLWNLVTGKKAGVLNFPRKILQSVQEGKYSSGEGRRIAWNPKGEEFAVAFERGAVIFGTDSQPRSRILPRQSTKLHQMRYVNILGEEGLEIVVLVVSTENGRVLFYSTDETTESKNGSSSETVLPDSLCLAQLDGRSNGVIWRVKDFEILSMPASIGTSPYLLAVTAGSDGSIRIWKMHTKDFFSARASPEKLSEPSAVGDLIGTYGTGNRITCLKAFVMVRQEDGGGLSEFEGLTEDAESASDSSEEDSLQ